MNKEEIKRQVDNLIKQINIWSKEKDLHQQKIYSIDKNMDELRDQIGWIRSGCVHTYLDKKPTMMGRGICEICGENDY